MPLSIVMRLPNLLQGGYNSANAARAWTFLTSAVVRDLSIGNADLMTLAYRLVWPASLSRCRDSRSSRISLVSTLVYAGRSCW